MENVTREQFFVAYTNHLPSDFTFFVFKYFSTSTPTENMKPSRNIMRILIAAFFLGFIGTILKLPRTLIAIPTYILVAVLTTVVGCMFFTHIANNLRLRRIAKELGVTREEYNQLAFKYFT